MGRFGTDFQRSWMEEGKINSTEELLEWIRVLNKTTYVDIHECSINDSTFWFYDDYNGEVLNLKRSFFSITGLRRFDNGQFIEEQPIIMQPEIGYLGIICKKMDGILYLLMQAKIEPGNVNCVQISPTIQATKSNFTRAHGGKLPVYFSYFEHAKKHHVIYDQLQTEQSMRFYKKRNRNMIIEIEEDIEIYPNFKWMTLKQISDFMKIDNLVNMDTRTVLSGITANDCHDLTDETLIPVYSAINHYKMFCDTELVRIPLKQLVDWEIDEYGITCKKRSDFMVRYYKIEIAGREIRSWIQPLCKALGQAVFGLIIKMADGKTQYLIKLKSEIGTFDKVEIGPSVQMSPIHYLYHDDEVEKVFRRYFESGKGIIANVLLSEEGGRFYHEQNRNVIIEIPDYELTKLPDNYFWVTHAALENMMMTGNCLNIQLRSLMSLQCWRPPC